MNSYCPMHNLFLLVYTQNYHKFYKIVLVIVACFQKAAPKYCRFWVQFF